MKIVFLGTPKFGADVLNILLKSRHEVAAVVCQPDREGNRKRVEICPVKVVAQANGIKLFQFEKISREGVDVLRGIDADAFITAAYGQMLSQEILSLPKYGVFNVHGSLLPKYRGAAPVQFALLNDESETGVSIMKTELEMDSGDVVKQVAVAINQDDNAATVLDKLADVGGQALLAFLDDLENGTAVFQKQDGAKATYCSKIGAETAKIDWSKSNNDIFNKIRALNPNPVANTSLDGVNLKIYDSRPSDFTASGACGEVVECSKKALTVQCGDGCLDILSLQLAGGKVLSFKDFVNGRKINKGDILGK